MAATLLRICLLFCVVSLVASGGVAAQEEGEAVTVSNAEELDDIRDDLGGDYVLAGDIDLSGTANFEPIGDGRRGDRGEEPFTGSFDGNGHTVTGLSVARPGESYVGLFGAVGRDGAVTQVGLEEADVEGGDHVGGIAGLNRGNVTDSYVDGTVSGEGENVGGVVGWNRGLLTRSYSVAGVTGDLRVGGVAGSNDGGGTVSSSYAAGGVSATAQAGGLVGMLGNENQLEGRESVLRDSYWDTDATGQNDEVGNMRAGEGEFTIENVEGLTTSEMQGTDVEERMTAFDFAGTWEATEEYPVLSWQASIIPGEDTPLPGFGFLAGTFALFVAVLLRFETRRRTDNS